MTNKSAVMTRPRPQDSVEMFLPDVLLPQQILELRNGGHATGERHLLIAVLEDAIHCFQKFMFPKNAQQRRLFREAEQWLMSEELDTPLTFNSICHVIGLDPSYLRRGLHKWQEQRLAQQWRPRASAGAIQLRAAKTLSREPARVRK